MNHQTYVICVAMFIAGQLLLLFWFTIPQLKEKCRIANKVFTWKEWWNCDWNFVIGNMVFGAMLILAIDELVYFKPGVLDYIKWLFGVAGAFLPTIIQEKWGNFKKGISKLIDVKTNLADAITGGTNTVQETIQAAKDTTGMDVSVTPKQ